MRHNRGEVIKRTIREFELLDHLVDPADHRFDRASDGVEHVGRRREHFVPSAFVAHELLEQFPIGLRELTAQYGIPVGGGHMPSMDDCG